MFKIHRGLPVISKLAWTRAQDLLLGLGSARDCVSIADHEASPSTLGYICDSLIYPLSLVCPYLFLESRLLLHLHEPAHCALHESRAILADESSVLYTARQRYVRVLVLKQILAG